MIIQPDACIVRITNSQGETLGTGFLVSADGRIATCAHVVQGTQPHVAFPDCEPRPAQVVAVDEAHDVAILWVEGDLPAGAAPARLGRSAAGHYHGFRSRGYRPLGGMEGIPAEGRVLDAVSECPGVQYKPLVLQIQHVRGGMSGAPVYVPDQGLVVGMISGYWDSLMAQTGFSDRDTAMAAPAEAIAAFYPDVLLEEPPLRPSRLAIGTPFQAPAVPRHFVPRPEVSQKLMEYLAAEAPPGALVVSAVHGLGGIGKTTLVAALAHDPASQARFPDGVLWVTLGQQPDVLSLLAGWIRALGDYDFHPTVIESASSHLRTLLHDKACLLVVDDAWQANHVRPFLVGGECCRVLVTTRDAALARKVGAQLYNLDVMTEAQALALFEARLGALDGDRDQAAALARELGYLPLALELAAAQVEAGISWTKLLHAFRQRLADLAVLDLDEATYRNESLRLSFRLSLERLSDEDQNAFAWLGVLPEDARLNPAMAATLWDRPEAEAHKRLHRLRDKALLKPAGGNQYMVHDLLHDEAKLRLTERVSLEEAHAVLLDRYRQKVPNERWDRLPDDGYIHEYLTWHMEQAKQVEGIHTLLRLETQAGRNAWYETRERLGQTAGFLEDVRRAWRLAEEQVALTISQAAGAAIMDRGEGIGLQCRYALVTASLKSLAKSIPPTLLAALVAGEVWPPAQALVYARQVPEGRQRAEVLVELAPHLSEELLLEALTVAWEIENKWGRARALAALAPYLSEPLLKETLAAARETKDEWVQVEALSALAPRLPEPLLREALAAAREIENKWGQANVLARLVPRLAQLGYCHEALATMREIRSEGESVEALIRLTRHLPKALLQQALATVREIRHEWWRARAIAGLAPYLPEPLLREALAAARGIWNEWSRMEALAGLLPRLAELGHPQEALSLARELRDERWQAKALAELAMYLPEPLPREALTAARKIMNKRERAEVLAELARRWREPALREALAALREIGDKWKRAEALARLATRLPEKEREETLQEALVAARDIRDDRRRARALAKLAPYLPEPLLREALAALREIGDKWKRTGALASLATRLPEKEREETLREALAAAREIEDERARIGALVNLSPYLPEPLLREALPSAPQIGDREKRGKIPAGLLPRLAELGYPQEALVETQEIDDEPRRAETLKSLAPHLSEPLLREALPSARQIGDKEKRGEALAGLLPRLAELGYPQEALTETQEIDDEFRRAETLNSLAPYLPESLLREALAAARGIGEKRRRYKALAGLLPRLAELAHPQEALTETQEIDDEFWRAKTLNSLAPYLPESLLRKALAAARGIGEKVMRDKALAGLTPRLAELGYSQEALVAAQEIRDGRWRVEALAMLAPRLTELGYSQEALEAARKIREGRRRAIVLTKIAPYLPELLLREALTAAQEIRDGRWRVEALIGLMVYLPVDLREYALRGALKVTQEIANEWRGIERLTMSSAGVMIELGDPWEALAGVEKTDSETQQAEMLVKLAPHLSESLLAEALMAAQAISGRGARAEALASLATRLPEKEKEETLQEALTAVEEIEDERARAEVLTALFPYLSKSLLGEALTATREIRDERARVKALTALAPHLATWAMQERVIAHAAWRETLYVLTRRTRQNLLADLSALSPAIVALGGQEAIVETFRAIQDVGRWWP